MVDNTPLSRGFRVAFGADELFHLRTLSSEVPTIESAVARIALLRARMALPRGTVHVLSDVHGEHVKLRHVINNASGKLRPVVERLFAGRLGEEEQRRLLNLLYYPSEQLAALEGGLVGEGARLALVREVVGWQVELLRVVAAHWTVSDAAATFPEAWRSVMLELLVGSALGRDGAWFGGMVDAIESHGKGFEFIRYMSRVIRNLAVEEIVAAGDLGDRGPRIDKVIAYLMRQPNVSVIWGNHDVSWMGACLGQEALIATVVRISLRYGRLAQLIEGYGIALEPLRELAEALYGEDPCARFRPKVADGDLADLALVGRMQKAIAVVQFKLEGQLIARHPEWGMDARDVLRGLDLEAGEVALPGGPRVELADRRLPSVDPNDPNALHPAERRCMDRLRASFVQSPVLWEQMSWLFRRGAMYAVRDDHLIFHACLPVDGAGVPLSLVVDGEEVSGKALFDACQAAVHRAFRQQGGEAADFLWYLWAGPRSPLFGKDRMATFETYFVADKALHHETKNPWFNLLHDGAYVRGVLASFGVDPQAGVVVNGHVPVKIEKGESPVKAGGNAITIDGAFAAAYGDKGYSLVLEATGASLAQHHPFDSVSDSIECGADIVPEIRVLRAHDPPRRVADAEPGAQIEHEIGVLERLIVAYEENVIRERA